jgi:diguanylate cyclase (GGDEF)-like protein
MDSTQETRYKVLIVDDVPKNIQVAANILQKSGYQMAFAQDGPTAIEQTKTNRFDLILLDIMMPDMDGFEVCGRIKEIPGNQDIPIIFLTAKNDAESIVQGFQRGAMDYLTKPFNGAELEARVRTHLELYRSREKLKAANERLSIEIGQRRKAEEELRRSKEEYRQLSLHDNLTGLYNTRYLYDAMTSLKDQCRRDGSPFALIFMDIDNFKHVVDAHGHLNGSRALAEVAQTLTACIAEPAYGVAYGGDEFVIVLPGFGHEQALAKAQEIRSKMLATRYLPNVGDGVRLKASFGVATYPEDASDIRAILAKADNAMFHVKSIGKDAVGDVRGMPDA